MEILLENINKRNVIRLANSFNKIKHNLSIVAMDILFSLFANVRKEDKEFNIYEITINELNRRLSRKINKDSLKNALEELVKENVYHLSNPEIKFSFLEICEYRISESILIIKLNDMLKEYLLHLNKEYMRLNFDTFLKLKSCYSKILYCMLSQYKGMKSFEKSVEELRNILNIPNTFKYSNIKQRALVPTLKILRDTDEFNNLEFKEYKKVKSVNKIKFIIIENRQIKVQLNANKYKKKEEYKTSIYENLNNWSKENNNEVINDYENVNTYHSNEKEAPNIYSFLDEWAKS